MNTSAPNLLSAETRERDKIARLSKSLYERGLTAGSSGNISVRLDDGWLLTPTNSCLGELGGKATTPRKQAASRANGQKGGRPRKAPDTT